MSRGVVVKASTYRAEGHEFGTRHHHHHIMPLARISETLSRHPSLSSITLGWSSRLQAVSALSCCIKVLAGRPAFARPC